MTNDFGGKKFYGKDRREDNRRDENEHRINWQIRIPQVRVVKEEEQLGVMFTDEARRLAQDAGLDLVEVAPAARPPVCRIMDYSRFKYEQQLKKKEQAKKQREAKVQIKELRLRPGIADHDTDTKINQAKKFLAEGCKVQFNLQFRGQRELCHKDQGFAVMSKVVESLQSVCIVERQPRMDGNRITCCLAPKT
jgi:translation initiation factor IF-3